MHMHEWAIRPLAAAIKEAKGGGVRGVERCAPTPQCLNGQARNPSLMPKRQYRFRIVFERDEGERVLRYVASSLYMIQMYPYF